MTRKLKKIEAQESVEFTFINTTYAAINVDLFNINQLSNIPTTPSTSSPNTVTDTFGSTSAFFSIVHPTNGNLYVTDSNRFVNVYDVTNTLITSIDLGVGTTPRGIAYNPANDSVYVGQNGRTDVAVISCVTNTLTTTIAGLSGIPIRLAYNSISNRMYVTNGNGVDVINCVTNTLLVSIVLANSNGIAFHPTLNRMYVTRIGGVNRVVIIECVSNTALGTVMATGIGPVSICYNSTFDNMYTSNNAGNSSTVIDCSTDTVTATIALGIAPNDCATETVQDSIYYVSKLGDMAIVDCATDTLTTTINISTNLEGIIFSEFTNSDMYLTDRVGNRIFQVTTTGAPTNNFYVTGTIDYNYFLRNIENEPVRVKAIRLEPLTQIQLSNVIQVKHWDASGFENSNPSFPSNSVSSYQKQGNISTVEYKNLIFDGYTYFSQYKINANESVTMVLYYDQYNRSNFSLKRSWIKKPLIYGQPGDRMDIDMNHNEVRFKYDENYES